jgi:hypothetical protein
MVKKEIKDLKKSGILKNFIEYFEHNIKNKKAQDFWTNLYLSNIINSLNTLKKARQFKDPARDYLRKLIKEYRFILKEKTPPNNRINDIKFKIDFIKIYIDRFRRREKKELDKDLFVLDLYEFLTEFFGNSYKKNIIIADLCIISGLSGVVCWEEDSIQYYPTAIKYKITEEENFVTGQSTSSIEKKIKIDKQKIASKNEEHKNCNKHFDNKYNECKLSGNINREKPCPRAVENVKRRIKRLKPLFKQGLKDDRDDYIIYPSSSKEYTTFEQNRIRYLKNAIKTPNIYPAQKEAISNLLKNKKKLKRYIRSGYIKSHLNDFLRHQRYDLGGEIKIYLYKKKRKKNIKLKKYKTYIRSGLNFCDIPSILEELNIPRNKWIQYHKILADDIKLMNSFKISP